MGSGGSVQRVKTVYLDVNGKDVSIVFPHQCSSKDLKELLTSAAGLSKWATITLTAADDSFIAVNASMPANTPGNRYKLTHVRQAEATDQDMFQSVLDRVGEEFTKAFKIQEFTCDFSARISALEKQLEAEGMKTVEIEECKQDLQQLKRRMLPESGTTPQHTPLDQRRSQTVPRRDVSLYPKYVLTQETRDYLKTPTFDIWHWETNEMLCLMEHMFHDLGLVAELHINPITLRRWLLAIQENYRDNPFHNFRHCFCVTQMLYGMLHLCELRDVFTTLELATLLTAAVCHDLDHPGFNNNYQINAQTELAIRYNDISPLENHHCAVAFQLLEKAERNIFAYVRPEEFKKIRAGIIDLILSTDMSRHTEIMERFRGISAKGFDYNKDDHRRMLQVMLIKCCDISNEARPMEVSEPWVDCLLEEYFKQSDREKLEGLPVAPFMDRDKVTKPTAQIGFIRMVLIPMFEAMNKLYPALEDTMIRRLKHSLEHYEQLKVVEDTLKEDHKNTKRLQAQCAALPTSGDIVAVPLKPATKEGQASTASN